MFVTVEYKDSDGGIKSFFRDLFSFPEIEIQKVELCEGDCFYRLIATCYRGQIPTKEIYEKLKRHKGSVIFGLDFPCDEFARCLEFTPRNLPALLLFNSFYDYMKAMGLPPVKTSLTVFDPFGIYANILYRLVELFGKIEVYTEETAAYKKTSDFLMEEYGISVPIMNTIIKKAPSTEVILSPQELYFRDYFPGIVFTLSDKSLPCSCLLKGEGIDLPPWLDLIRPEGIDKMTFACALYEKSGVKLLGKLGYKRLRSI